MNGIERFQPNFQMDSRINATVLKFKVCSDVPHAATVPVMYGGCRAWPRLRLRVPWVSSAAAWVASPAAAEQPSRRLPGGSLPASSVTRRGTWRKSIHSLTRFFRARAQSQSLARSLKIQVRPWGGPGPRPPPRRGRAELGLGPGGGNRYRCRGRCHRSSDHDSGFHDDFLCAPRHRKIWTTAEYIGRAPGRGPEGTGNCSSCYGPGHGRAQSHSPPLSWPGYQSLSLALPCCLSLSAGLRREEGAEKEGQRNSLSDSLRPWALPKGRCPKGTGDFSSCYWQ